MIRLPVTLAALAFIATGAAAATATAKPAVAVKPAVVAKPVVVAKPAAAPAKPSMFSRLTNAMSSKPAPAAKPAVHHASASTGNIVTAKTSTGKTVHYDCSKAGNATKKACH